MRRNQFRTILPMAQLASALVFGGIGLWRRSAILNQPLFEGQTLWDWTARFHVWPWPYKFAVIANMPSFLTGSLLSWPVSVVWPRASEFVDNLPSLLCVPILWFFIGSWVDKRWKIGNEKPWIMLVIFNVVCLAGAVISIGYVGFLPYGIVVWVVLGILVRTGSKRIGAQSKDADLVS